jgi:hypothetical protein
MEEKAKEKKEKKEKKATEDTAEIPQFPINQDLLESSTEIKEQWRMIRDRLEKIETNRSEVSPAVYERVKADYHSRLEEITNKLMDKKQDIDTELESLYATRSQISEQLEVERQNLEEVKFRNMLGEFTQDEYQDKGREKQEHIGKLETAMLAVNTNISRYESIFHEEAELLGVEAATPETEGDYGVEEVAEAAEVGEAQETEAAVEIPPEEPVRTDEEGYIINETEGPDYFATGETAAGETGEHKIVEESQTARTPSTEGTEAAPEAEAAPQPPEEKGVLPRARVVIISGDEAGAAYPLKDTVTMGRADSNTICLKDAKVSRQHAQIQQHGKQYIVVDLSSSNGTFVNGEKIEEHVLQNNDEIQIGDYILQFQE